MNMLKQISIIGLTTLCLVFALAGYANAQIGDRVRLELERTDQVLERARASVGVNPLGSETLRRAEELQQKAKDLFNQGNYKMALELTLRAREQVRAAMTRGSMGEESDQVALRRLERATELLDRVGATLSPDTDRGQRALYDAARENLQRAWDLYRGERFRPAIKIAEQVENSARKILRQSERLGKWNDTFERRYLRATNHLAEFEERVADCESESASTLFKQAMRSLELARRLADEKDISAAMQALDECHKLTQQGLRECFGPKIVQAMIVRMESRLAILSDRIPTDDRRAQKILEQARRQIDLARGHLDHNRPEAAAASVRAAQQAFQKLARIAKEYDI
jgi:predicted S18 family serine protease